MSNATDTLKQTIENALEYFSKELERRAEWGSVTFESGSADFNKAKSLLSYFNALPLEYLPESIAPTITAHINHLIGTLDKIDKFKIETGNPTGTRDTLCSQLHSHVQNFYTHSATWVPFLAYQKGDITENINKLSSSVSKASDILDSATAEIDTKKGEIDSIILAAREASASAGAAVFTEDFQTEATANKTDADKWLKYTLWSIGITVVIAIIFWGMAYCAPLAIKDSYTAFQVLASKVVIISLSVSSSFWCARNYRVLMHLSKHNNHRALSLKTLQAFFKSASDSQAKDAVLLEVTRSVFGNVATGYLGGKEEGQNPSMNMIEVSKSFSGSE